MGSKENLKRHHARMRDAGFKRLAYWVHPDLLAEIRKLRKPAECGGRTLERLLLGTAKPRPEFWKQGNGTL